jgi:hypothetical protein
MPCNHNSPHESTSIIILVRPYSNRNIISDFFLKMKYYIRCLGFSLPTHWNKHIFFIHNLRICKHLCYKL